MGLFSKKKNQIFSPIENGILKTLNTLNDGVFSEGMLGQGFVVQQNDGNIYSPIKGTIISAFPTKHAYGIQNKNGLIVLVHIGIDTVSLNGEGFKTFVNVGDNVNQGDLIANVDLNLLKKHQIISDVICVITSDSKIQPQEINIKANKNVSKNDLILDI